MNNMEIFAARLKNARLIKGFSMDQLASAMNNRVSKMAISKYEHAQIFPDSSVMISFANALEQPVDYFFRPLTLQVDSIKFRKLKSRLSKKEEKSIKENISDLIERYINIEEICNESVKFDFSFKKSSDALDYKKAACKLRENWNLGSDGIVNVIDLLETNGIKVLEIDGSDGFDGLSSVVNDLYPVIVLYKNFPSERKRFTAMHELGHLVLNFPDDIPEKDEEKYCNLFASEMLIPESLFKKILGEKRHDISYQELKSIQLQYGISCDALMYKAKDFGVISENRYKTFCIQKSQRPDFKKLFETSLYPEEQSNRFKSLVYKALSNESITVSKAAVLLRQDIEQVRKDFVLA